jgi:alkylation response protein AidB-like acyl-CoA dehydrogenase
VITPRGVINRRFILDFAFDEQQEMLKTMARDFLSSQYPEKRLREMAADERGYPPELWHKMAEMNWTGLAIPEEYGGVGGFLDLAVVLEEMGRVCLISPFFATVVLGASTIIEAASHNQKQRLLPSIAEGKLILTLALTEPSARYTADAVTLKATPDNGDFVIQGTKLFVPDAHSSDYLICAARTKQTGDPEEGITLFLVDRQNPGIDCKRLTTIAGDKQCEVTFDKVRVPEEDVLGEVDKGWPCVAKVLEKAAVARCAEMVGGAQQVLEMTLNYAKERTAFGHPIGAFQSIQHRCADMLVDVEGSRHVTYQAAWRLHEGLSVAREAAIAKAWVSQACRRVVTSAHQVHGSIGFTQDHVLQYYTKRARAHEFSFGDVNFHLGKLASWAGNKSG